MQDRTYSIIPRLLLFALAAILLTGVPSWCASAADYRKLGDEAVKAGKFGLAGDDYRLEADIYEKIGDHNAAVIERNKADQYATALDLFAEVKPDAAAIEANYTGAKFEPLYGCYVGVFVDNDPNLEAPDSHIGIVARTVEFRRRVGKLTCAWEYCRYGQDFPFAWARSLIKQGITPHLALEPDRLSDVHDDEYLHGFAKDAKMCGGPIFLRFAGEMNGNWTPYHDDPQAYIAKFRLVHDAFAEEAPNVAMIWCVNALPDTNWDQFYPGDAYVDWVGVNFYSVVHHDNDPNRPAWMEHPTSMLDSIYARYGSRKPIAICEYGSSHQESMNISHDYSDVAAEKISSLFAALPRKYPRVKMVDLFDSDNLTAEFIQPGRQLNNYCVTDTPTMLDAVRRGVASNYFLPQVIDGSITAPKTQFLPLTADSVLAGPVRLSVFSLTYDPKAQVTVCLDGQTLVQDTTPGDHSVSIEPESLSFGRHTVRVEILDSEGHTAAERKVNFLYGSMDEVASVGTMSPPGSPVRTTVASVPYEPVSSPPSSSNGGDAVQSVSDSSTPTPGSRIRLAQPSDPSSQTADAGD